MNIDGVSHGTCSFYNLKDPDLKREVIEALKIKIKENDRGGFTSALINAKKNHINLDEVFRIDDKDNTLLEYALKESRYSIAYHMITSGVDLNYVNEGDGNSILMTLLENYFDNEEDFYEREMFMNIFSILIDKEEDINKTNKKGETVPMLLLSETHSEIEENDLIDMLNIMEAKGIDMKMKAENGSTLISKAIMNTDGDRVLEKIISMGANVNDYAIIGNECNYSGFWSGWETQYDHVFTPLHIAIVRQDLAKVKSLIKHGAAEYPGSCWDANGMGGRKQISPLKLAEKLGDEDIINFLKESDFRKKYESSRWCDSDDDNPIEPDDIFIFDSESQFYW